MSRAAELSAHDGSISGGSSSMLLHSAKMKIDSVKPHIVSLMIGSNDSVSVGKESLHQVSIGEYARNVGEIIGWVKKSGAKILLLEIPPIHEARFACHAASRAKLQSNATIRRYNEALRGIADVCGVKTVSHDWFAAYENFDPLFEPDGTHLSIKGQELLARHWLNAAMKI